jgi:hypothetical protein
MRLVCSLLGLAAAAAGDAASTVPAQTRPVGRLRARAFMYEGLARGMASDSYLDTVTPWPESVAIQNQVPIVAGLHIIAPPRAFRCVGWGGVGAG